MIHIDFDPDQLAGEVREEWDNWQKKATAFIEQAIASWEAEQQPSLNAAVWKDLRDWLLEHVFRGKCAYCETRLVRSTYDAEHFRPKARVQVLNANNHLETIAHPGYFWLAYFWKNILPSCEFCNRSGGKANQFPVRNQHVTPTLLTEDAVQNLLRQPFRGAPSQAFYYLHPDDLDVLEEPLLLNPYVDQPDDHLDFTDGIAAPRNASERGRVSVEVYNLNDERIIAARLEAQDIALTQFLLKFATTDGSIQDKQAAAQAAILEYKTGEAEYSAAVMDYLQSSSEKLVEAVRVLM